MYRTTLFTSILVLSLSVGCKKKKTEEANTTTTASGSANTMATGSGSAEGSAGSAEGSAGSGSAPAAASGFDPGELQTPESVLYDAGRDMYMVSNINGKPTEADDNGYLTVVNPDGSNERANANWKWIAGEAGDIKLDAPKGMAISGDTLYVADISVVRRFEAKPGKQKDDVKIDGASFLNDVTPDGKDGVFVTDTGVDAAFKPTGTDAVYHVDKDGKVKPVVKAKDLGNPNGVWFDGKNTLWVVTFGSGEIYDVDIAKGKKGKATKLPKGQLDGIVGGLDGGDFLVSSWECKCVYRGKPGGEWKPIVEDVESPADIDYDPKRKRLLIPGFATNKITVHQL
jgi:sugar lactone lactonase YvrE